VIIIFILNIAAFIFMLGLNLSTGFFSAYLKSLGATALIISLGSSALYVTRGSASILIDKLSKIISFKRLFILSFIGSAISTMLLLSSFNPVIVALLRTFQGIFSGIYWVMINIYAIHFGSSNSSKFKNLTSVTMFINLGGFIGSIAGGKLAEAFSPNLCFYLGTIILIIGAIVSLKLEDIKSKNKQSEKVDKNLHTTAREKLIIIFAILSSTMYSYISIGIPLFILQLGGSYKEIGITSGLGIGAGVLILSIAPIIKKYLSYGSIIKIDYILIMANLSAIFYFKSIFLIYFLQSVLIGIVALERNLWYSILHDHSNNYNKSIGILRGFMDYFGMVLFLIYGFFIEYFGATNVAMTVVCITFIFLMLMIFSRRLKFLKTSKAVHIHGVCQYNHMLHANGLIQTLK
jgi:MFS family permease